MRDIITSILQTEVTVGGLSIALSVFVIIVAVIARIGYSWGCRSEKKKGNR